MVELPALRNVLVDVFGGQEVARSFFGRFIWDVYGFRDLLRRHGAVVCGAGVLGYFIRAHGDGWDVNDDGLKELVVCVGISEEVSGRTAEWVRYLVHVEGMRYLGTVMKVWEMFRGRVRGLG